MRVLVVSDYYPPFIGGGHRATQALARRLSAAGHVVTVATVSHPGVPAHETDGGVDVRRLPHLRSLLRPLRRGRRQEHHPPFPDPLTTVALRRLLRETRPEVVYAYGWIAYSAALARLGTGVPLVLGAHDYGFTCPTRTLVRGGVACSGPGVASCLACAPRTYGWAKGWLTTLTVLAGRPLLRRSARGLHSISAYVEEVTTRDLLRGRPGPPLVRCTLPSFSDETDDEGSPEEIAAALARLPGEPFVLFVGALRRVKGVDVLLDAYARLDGPPPLVLLGTVESDSPTAWPEGVVVLEDVPHGAVMQAWSRCLFGVAPSRWPEPLGLVVHEGMSRGRAVIGTRPGGHADLIVDGESGLLVPAGDAAALAEAMRTLLARPDLRRRLGAAAELRAEEASGDRLLPAYEGLLREVAESRP
jgi:glycosyltransferase involved in cell wall biosynthesis